MKVRRSHFCSCGQIVRGNFAKRQHREVHRGTSDGHEYVSMDIFRQRFPDWRGGPQGRQIPGPNCTCHRGESGCPLHAPQRAWCG